MSDERLYFAYGSNINLEQMAYRCPNATVLMPVVLSGYELVYRASGVATVIPQKDSEVLGLMWSITPECEKSLDRYEGFPSYYRKEMFDIEIGGETRTAMAYVMNRGAIDIPSDAYYNGIMKGYLDNGMDPKPLQEAYDRAVEGRQDIERMYQSFFDLKGGW